MRIDTSAQNRKDVVKAVSELIGIASQYMGPPTFAYQIGSFTVDREGFVETEKEEEGTVLLQGLIEMGLAEGEQEVKTLEINIPTQGMAGRNMVNLIFSLHSKQYLLNRSIAKDIFHIPSNLIEVLDRTDIPDRDTFLRIFRQYEESSRGISFTDENVIFTFPFENEPDILRSYTELSARMVKQAKEQKRISHKETIVENEKYYMRVWLLRLGFGGKEGKESRKLLLKNLKGHSAFRMQEEIERAKQRNRQRKTEVEKGKKESY